MAHRLTALIILIALAGLAARWLNARSARDATRSAPAAPQATSRAPATTQARRPTPDPVRSRARVSPAVRAGVHCPPADPSLILEGTAVFDRADNFALIEAQGRPRLVRAGQRVHGHLVRRIDHGRMVLEREGAPVCLTASRSTSASTNRATKGPARSEVRQLGKGQYQVDRAWLIAQLKDLPRLARQVRVRPKRQGDRMVGFTVARLQKGSVFERLGLRAGDVLLGANGEALDNPGRILRLYQGLADADGVTVQLARRGRPMTLDFAVQ